MWTRLWDWLVEASFWRRTLALFGMLLVAVVVVLTLLIVLVSLVIGDWPNSSEWLQMYGTGVISYVASFWLSTAFMAALRSR